VDTRGKREKAKKRGLKKKNEKKRRAKARAKKKTTKTEGERRGEGLVFESSPEDHAGENYSERGGHHGAIRVQEGG